VEKLAAVCRRVGGEVRGVDPLGQQRLGDLQASRAEVGGAGEPLGFGADCPTLVEPADPGEQRAADDQSPRSPPAVLPFQKRGCEPGAQGGARLDEQPDVGVAVIEIRVRLQAPGLDLELARLPEVVVVEERDKFPPWRP
jgi:hypothetical protein